MGVRSLLEDLTPELSSSKVRHYYIQNLGLKASRTPYMTKCKLSHCLVLGGTMEVVLLIAPKETKGTGKTSKLKEYLTKLDPN